MSIAYKRVFHFILLISTISFSHAFVSKFDTINDVNKQIETIDEQIALINNKLTLENVSQEEAETFKQLKADLIAEKESLKAGVESFRKLEEKALLRCTPPSIFQRNINQIY